MTRVRASLIIIAALALVAGLGGVAYAFHAGGVAECIGCHSMHSPAPGGSYLLVGTDVSSTCLTCHQRDTDTGPTSYHISTAPGSLGAGQAPLQRTPGGDFGWLKKSYTFTVRGSVETEDGQHHGHNIVATDFGFVEDSNNTTAPGGTFVSAALACNSCHDPHGTYRRLSDNTIRRGATIGTATAPIIGSGSYASTTLTEPPGVGTAYGVYRLLGGAGYEKAPFPGVPAAKVPSSYNRTEATTQTRTAYGRVTTSGHAGWGYWCGACHGAMHSDGNYVHPVDEDLGSSIANLYNAYVKSGDMTGGASSSFTSLVPFVKANGTTYAQLATLAVNNDSQLGGPASTDQVSCLSCHRAHASGWPYALRWNIEGEFMTYNSLYPGTDSTPTVPQFHRGRTAAETQAAYYDRPASKFASYQRVLCNKCHAKD